jgi:hypothetical protein
LGLTADVESRKIDKDLATYLPLDYERGEENAPKILESAKIEQIDEKFLFDIAPTVDNVFVFRITVLEDATLLSFGFSHHLADATASLNVMKAFCALLSDKPIPELVLPPDSRGVKLSETVVDKAEDLRSVPSIRYTEHKENFDYGFLKIVRALWRMLRIRFSRWIGWRERLEARLVYLPGPWVDQIRAKVLNTIKTQQSSSEDGSHEPTRNDIINACFLKTVYAIAPASDDRMDFYGPMNYRQLIVPPPEGTYYIHNSFGFMRCKFSINQLRTDSITKIAQNLRLTTLRYKQASSIREYLRYCEDNSHRRLFPSIRSGSGLSMTMITSWTTCDYFGLDFSRAAVGKSQARVTFVNPMVRNLRDGMWPVAVVVKSGDWGYWLRGLNTPTGWEHFYGSTESKTLFPAG